MSWITKLAVVGSLAAIAMIAARADEAPSQLIGTWKLISNTLVEIPSGARTDLMGPHPIGYISYGKDGRMMILQVRQGRKKPEGPAPTSAEAETLFKSFLGYAGTYTVSGNKVTHHVDLSWNETWTGTDQVRLYKFNGNRVTLSTETSPDPIHGKMSVRELVWEKIQ